MSDWIFFFLNLLIESYGLIYFFDSFMPEKKKESKWKKIIIMYVIAAVVTLVIAALFPELRGLLQVLVVTIALSLYVWRFYDVRLSVGTFFAALGFMIHLMVDAISLGVAPNDMVEEHSVMYHLYVLFWLGVWILLEMLLRKRFHHIKDYVQGSSIQWTYFWWFPIISAFMQIYCYQVFIDRDEYYMLYLVFAFCLLVLNISSLYLLQDALVKEERIRISNEQQQKIRNQYDAFKDMKYIYESQGRKLHDYKKQLTTVQELIKNGQVTEAYDYIGKLTKSITVEMSEINVGHPVINAVLNQQYRTAKSKGIGVVFSVCDLSKVQIDDEDIVVLLGNLLENAIHECERIMDEGRVATIQLKLIEKNGSVIITVKNPVRDVVPIKDNKVQKERIDGHGIGLSNVEEIVRRYDGSFAISCDEEKFNAIVII